MRTVETSCDGKRRYSSWGKAEHAAKGARRRDHRVLTAYHCQHCGGFHIGNDGSNSKQIKDLRVDVYVNVNLQKRLYRRSGARDLTPASEEAYDLKPQATADATPAQLDESPYAVDDTEYPNAFKLLRLRVA